MNDLDYLDVDTALDRSGRPLTFYIKNGAPTLPLKFHGEIWSLGWDIPTIYAIDGDNVPWEDNAHGGALYKTNAESLISGAIEEGNLALANKIRSTFGLKVPSPEWAPEALALGWTPPPGWKS